MKTKRRSLMLRAKRWAPLLIGGFALQLNLTGCDPTVREMILGGVQTSLTSMMNAIINAFFTAISTSGSSTSQPVVKAIIDTAQSWVA